MLHSFVVPYVRIAANECSDCRSSRSSRPCWWASDAVVTTRPPARRSRSRCVSRNGARWLSAKVCSKPSGVTRRCENIAPALLARTSMRGWRPRTSAASARTSSMRARSATCSCTGAPPPAARASSATARTRSASRPTRPTSAPRRASSTAAARPMPRVAPVSRTKAMAREILSCRIVCRLVGIRASTVTVRILIGLLAAFRAVLIYGEASAAESWQPARPLRRAKARTMPHGSAVVRACRPAASITVRGRVLGLVFTNLARRKARAAATAAGIALGVATIVALLSVGSGLKRTAGQLVHLGQADLGIFQSGVADPTASVLPTSLAQRLERRPDVAEATPLLLIIEGVRQDPAAVVFGADPEGFFRRRLVVTGGRGAGGGGGGLVGDRLAAQPRPRPGSPLRGQRQRLTADGGYHPRIYLSDARAALG